MSQLITYLFTIVLSMSNAYAPESVIQPAQPTTGPGGTNYAHTEINSYDHSSSPKGYWMYTPKEVSEAPIDVIVFMHGYGAMNPMIYGGWIKHLVKQNNVVIFPRYQRGILTTHPNDFAANAAVAIKDAKKQLEEDLLINANWDNLSLVGHSYGGVIISNLAVNYADLAIPKPKAVMMCSPGTGPLKGGRLDSYENMDSDIKLIVMVSEDDYVVGDKFGYLVFNSAQNVINRNFIRQFRDSHGAPRIGADHNQCYSLDQELDSGYRNVTTKRALRISKIDAIDYNGYWKLFDALRACAIDGNYCDYAFGDTQAQSSLGSWSDGTPINKLEITLP